MLWFWIFVAQHFFPIQLMSPNPRWFDIWSITSGNLVLCSAKWADEWEIFEMGDSPCQDKIPTAQFPTLPIVEGSLPTSDLPDAEKGPDQTGIRARRPGVGLQQPATSTAQQIHQKQKMQGLSQRPPSILSFYRSCQRPADRHGGSLSCPSPVLAPNKRQSRRWIGGRWHAPFPFPFPNSRLVSSCMRGVRYAPTGAEHCLVVRHSGLHTKSEGSRRSRPSCSAPL